ncbi:MAG TPA: hypothetical protein VGF48_07250 [Thermoanaerobaculia bacterium]
MGLEAHTTRRFVTKAALVLLLAIGCGGPEVRRPRRHVRTLGGKEGWVRTSDVRTPIGYRAGFSKRYGAWKMDALVAGD